MNAQSLDKLTSASLHTGRIVLGARDSQSTYAQAARSSKVSTVLLHKHRRKRWIATVAVYVTYFALMGSMIAGLWLGQWLISITH